MADPGPVLLRASTDTRAAMKGGTRAATVEALLDEMDATFPVPDGMWDALSALIVDATLDNDDKALEASYTGLQWLWSDRETREEGDVARQVEQGRAQGMLDLTRWHLRHSVSTAAALLERDGLGARLLGAIAAMPGSSNQLLAEQLGVDATQLSRLGRHLRAATLAWSQKAGRVNAWFVTPRGTQTLHALDLRVEGTVAPSASTAHHDPHVRVGGASSGTDGQSLARQLAEGGRSMLPEGVAPVLANILWQGDDGTRDVLSHTGLPDQAVDEAIRFLVHHGYVVHEPATHGTQERLRVNDDRYRAVGVSVTPSEVTGVLTTLRASNVTMLRRPLPSCDPETVIRAISQVCEELIRNSGVSRDEVVGLGINLPGHIDPHVGIVKVSPLGGGPMWEAWRDFPLAERLFQVSGLPTTIENDVNALALHEQFFGDGRGLCDFAVVYVTPDGEGVGSGIVVGGSLLHGAHGIAGELGHVPVGSMAHGCRCGNAGCLESEAGLSAIRRSLGGSAEGKILTLPEASAAAEGDNAAASGAFADAGAALGRGIATLLNVLNPELVILSGPAELVDVDNKRRSARLFTDAALEGARRFAYSEAATSCRLIKRSLTGSYAARGGASALLLRRLYESAAGPVAGAGPHQAAGDNTNANPLVRHPLHA